MTGPAGGTSAPEPRRRRARWRWSTWSITHKIPALTAAIVALVIALSLVFAYDALTRGRIEGAYDRLRRLARQIALSSEQNIRVRAGLYRQAAGDSAVRALLRAGDRGVAPRGGEGLTRAAEAALLELRTAPDSSLPIELWTADGRRVLHVGTDVRGDSLVTLRPELRAGDGRPLGGMPGDQAGDSILYGAFYESGGRILFWTVVPVLEHGRRIGYIAQERGFRSTPDAQAMMRELLGNDATLNVHNTVNDFWASYAGRAIPPLTGVDTGSGDFIGDRAGIGAVIASEARVRGTPWIFSIEAPVETVLAEPRTAIRRLALAIFTVALFGVLAAWVASRRITRPLVTLTSMSEAIARGDYDRRVPEEGGEGTRNEVARLAASFNRMAAEIESTHRALERQVAEAVAVSQKLEMANQELQHISHEAHEARTAAEKANRAKSDFLAVMSHELRTPLNAIGGYAEIMQLGIYGGVTPEQRDALRRIHRSQHMLLALINDVLNFAKLDAGQVQYQMADVPVDETLAGVEPVVAPQLAAKGITFRFERCVAGLVAHADADKLQQVVVNLVSNAIKFTPSGGAITVACSAESDDEGDWVLVHVRDTGVGISPERHEAIFDPFVQGDRALNRPHEGIGLGLSISRDLARGMGGSLGVESEVGRGSTFTLRLRRVA